MKIGAEPKKVAILAVLMTAAGVLFYRNVFSGSEAPSPSRPAAATVRPATPAPVGSGPVPPNIRRARSGPIQRSTDEFKPSLRNVGDVSKVDPTLRLDLLAKVVAVEREGGSRSLFQFSAPPAPPAPKVDVAKIIPKTPEQIKAEQARATSSDPAKPPPPPITLKFYGYSSARVDGRKRAFFLDGEDIYVVSEGDLIKRRYKVVRIGVNSVVMEDTEHKNQQTIILQQEQAG